ncbi:hypothetical protein WJX81_000611 [Elliptochloris bilobata]|uniref:DUF3730 domain-containing protein n=1 Tax=Elliptochloris bilobata TaxID=381761 RepID=A0AAW1RR32_9CHLO
MYALLVGTSILRQPDVYLVRSHEPYAKESRAWRQGMRTYVATNYAPGAALRAEAEQHNETWAAYPDDRPLRSLALKGDSRAALAPHFGGAYKWLLYGDDDTFFFTDAMLGVLGGLDPDMPYFLTDHLWWSSGSSVHSHALRDTHHPHGAAPRCVPCGYLRNTSALPFPAPAGCPCTPHLLCAADRHGVMFQALRGPCGMPRVPVATYSMHGGAGALLSVGLLRAIDFEAFEDCVLTTYSTGGDAFISICLWQAGYGMTDIDPFWHPSPMGRTMFDVGRVAQQDGQPVTGRIAPATQAQGLDRLAVDNPVIQRIAVGSVFHLLGQHGTYKTKAGTAAIQQCLGHSSNVVVDEAAQQLCSFVPRPGLSADDAYDLLLAAVSAAGAPEAWDPPAWQAHPLSKLLLAQPAVAAPLLEALARLLAGGVRLPGHTASAPQDHALGHALLLRRTAPFLSFALLEPDLAGERASFRAALHSALVRLACSGASLPALVALLAAHMGCHAVGAPGRRSWLLGALDDVVDALEAAGPQGAPHAPVAAAALTRLALELQVAGGPTSPPLRGLHRLARAYGGVLAPHAPELALLATRCAGGADLCAVLALLMREAARPGGSFMGARAALLLAPLGEAPGLVLTALLGHESGAVAGAAAEAAAAAVACVPLAGIGLLPMLLFQLQDRIARDTGGALNAKEALAKARALLALLRALPAMGAHAAAAPFVVRALQPFCQSDAPELLQALALRLQLRLWRASGRGFARLEAALLDYAAPGAKPGRALRLARAACLRDVCVLDPDRGIRLVRGLQECFCDEDDAVAALGLEGVGALCEADALDFYGAWRVVHAALPALPAPPRLAAAWVGLLAHGALDAAAHPEKAGAVVSLLWAAAGHAHAVVRHRAYQGLAGYALDALEEVEALRPLQDYAAPLVREADAHALSAAGTLVNAALAYEHANRRRLAARPGASTSSAAHTGAGAAATRQAGSLPHRLARALPRRLCAEAANPGLGSAPGALLLFWAPAAPPPGANAAARAAAARSAADAYSAKFGELAGAADWAGEGQGGLAIASWRAFVGRWLAAARATQRSEQDGSGNAAEARVWAQIQGSLGSALPATAAGAALAAGALAAQLAGRSHGLASAVVTRVSVALKSNGSAAVGAAAALATSAALPALHPTDADARAAALDGLAAVAVGHPNGAAHAAALEALGQYAGGLLGGPGDVDVGGTLASHRAGQELRELLDAAGTLMSTLSALCPPLAHGVTAAAAAAPPGWSTAGPLLRDVAAGGESPDDDAESILGALAGLAHLAEALGRAGGGVSIVSGAGVLPGAGATKAGAAAGLAALLGARGLVPGLVGGAKRLPWLLVDAARGAVAKHALHALETLAFQEPDPRPRRAAAWALAAACAACREAEALAGSKGASAARSAAGGGARVLRALPADGAMRALAEALLESPGAGDAALPEVNTAAALQALAHAGAGTLPTLDWGALCHRLLRTHPPSVAGPSPAGEAAAWGGARAWWAEQRAADGVAAQAGAGRADLEAAALAALEGMLHALPPPPELLPGEEDLAESVWAAALRCLEALPAEQAVSLLEVDAGDAAGAARSVFARAWLVRRGTLPLRDLQACRVWVMEHAAGAPLMVPVALAACVAPQTAQQQMLIETLDIALAAASPKRHTWQDVPLLAASLLNLRTVGFLLLLPGGVLLLTRLARCLGQPKARAAAPEDKSDNVDAAQQCKAAEKLTPEDLATLLRITPRCSATGHPKLELSGVRSPQKRFSLHADSGLRCPNTVASKRAAHSHRRTGPWVSSLCG